MKKAANANTQLVFSSRRRTKVNAVTPDNWPRALPCYQSMKKRRQGKQKKPRAGTPSRLQARQT